MANKTLGGRAGIYHPWDGKLTGAQSAGEPGRVADRNQSWSSVQKKQAGRLFTADEVRQLVAEIVTAVKSGKEVDLDTVIPAEEKHVDKEEMVIGGK